ncbi:MAG: precorrin-6y C5,15-methyltransferase (decarboxylating) subunit CbiE [Synergistaceae bacterium]|jgi:precorrin-6Y C5,15-methyltransferase (decarboxylating)|nr:precorrin-6y C5,15-methyltransferase (decarboxylating) subunit CbiE [Synergistaceae bacterium]
MRHKLVVVSVGPGDAGQLTRAAEAALKTTGCLFAAKRHLESGLRELTEGHSNVILMEDIEKTLSRIGDNLERGDVAVAVSGDAGVFSLLPKLRERFPDREIETLPGVSALQSLCAALCETWDDAKIVSLHGRNMPPSKVAGIVATNRRTIFFCGPNLDPASLCRILSERGLNFVEIAVGERLSCPDGRVVKGRPSELCGQMFDPLSVVMATTRQDDLAPYPSPGLEDAEILREPRKIPMTRMEVRTIILSRLRLEADSVVWDIGAGTGSVSIACARACPYGEVHAVERLPEAARLVRSNGARFRAHNLFVHEGNAAELLESLPRPNAVFIGGSGGELRQILERVAQIDITDCPVTTPVRVVVSGVTLGTIAVASDVLNGPGFRDFEAAQISVTRSQPVGNSVVMAAQNPVTIFSAWTTGPGENVRPAS